MRTTLDIEDEVLDAARKLSKIRNEGVGKVLSDLARRGLEPEVNPVVEVRSGVPVWTHRGGAIAVTSEMVRHMAEDE